MSRNTTKNKSLGVIGVALAGLVLSGSAFAMQPLSQGYMLAASHAGDEGKCGEGKCGTTEAKPAKTAANKSAEGKCGEGKCGATEAKTANTAGAKKTAEGKCGEGKCGDARFAQTDTDDDGRVSRAEFLAVVPNGTSYFALIDKSGDGYINEREAYDNVKRAFESNGKSVPAGLFANYAK